MDKLKKNKNLVIGVIIVLVVAVLLVLILTNIFSKDNSKNNKQNKIENKVESNEKTIEKDYSFTKEDALKIIKNIYNSDNYSFDATAGGDNTYIVTVTNTDTNESVKYSVDPSDGSFSQLEN